MKPKDLKALAETVAAEHRPGHKNDAGCYTCGLYDGPPCDPSNLAEAVLAIIETLEQPKARTINIGPISPEWAADINLMNKLNEKRLAEGPGDV